MSRKHHLFRPILALGLLVSQVALVYFILNTLLPAPADLPYRLLAASEEDAYPTEPPKPQVILATRNGGLNWTRVYSTTEDLYNLNCPTTDACAVLYGGEQLLVTGDSGQSWVKRGLLQGKSITNINCPGPLTCYALAYSRNERNIYATLDGGISWLKQRAAPQDEAAHLLACPTTTACYALGAKGIALTTADGGQNWRSRQLETSSKNSPVAMSCPSSQTCFAVYRNNQLKRTEDGGQHWFSSTFPAKTNALEEISCPSIQICYLLGSGDKQSLIFKSTDSGQSWQPLSPGTADYFDNLKCPSTLTCYLSGSEGWVRVTSDGGQSWQLRDSGVREGLSEMACPEVQTCYVLSAREED